MNADALDVRGQGTKVPHITTQHVPPGLGEGHDERIDCGARLRLRSECGRPSGDPFRRSLKDLAGLEEAVHMRMSALFSTEALDEHDRGHDRRPQPLPSESLDLGQGVRVATSKTRDTARVQYKDAQTAFLVRRRPISAAIRLARSVVTADGSPTSFASLSM